jgi:hypothetical protein
MPKPADLSVTGLRRRHALMWASAPVKPHPRLDTTLKIDVTPRGSLRGIAACRQVLQKAGGDEQFARAQAEPEFEDVGDDVIARTREIARWRETGERMSVTLLYERIVRIVVMPGGARASHVDSGSQAG